ncbi:hypothetical protein ACQFX9_10400 [Aliinostoc sp. HNIBRCY26]|uniref:hypothetical protein n=1 Tax=Aliinostoc sp. HNIBRCY26 TaxID=3418997 RepID=UPI003CFBDD6B
MNHNNTFCCCTMALGRNYCALALELAKDIEKHSPGLSLVVLTDVPEYFQEQSNVLAFKHHQVSLGCYHDKRFVLEKALSLFNSCLFIDADMRILAPIPLDKQWQPGITAKIVWEDITKHNQNPFEMGLIGKICQKLNLRIEDISFIHECLFVVTRDSGLELDFLKYWDKIAPYFEIRGFCRGEGHTMGLAAAKVGFPIRRDAMDEIVFFKDKLELQTIKNDQSNLLEKAEYFEKQRTLEYPQISIFHRSLNKLRKTYYNSYRLLKLLAIATTDFNFYYR